MKIKTTINELFSLGIKEIQLLTIFKVDPHAVLRKGGDYEIEVTPHQLMTAGVHSIHLKTFS